MHVIALSVLRGCWERHRRRGLESLLRAWYREVEAADWQDPAELKARFPHASFLNDNRVCFNVGGNKYRIIALVFYKSKRVYIRFAGTHDEYDRIDADRV
jgi:mRNA interferase HigB